MLPSETDPLLIDCAEVCRLLGFGRSLLYGMIASGKAPPSFRVCRKRMFRRADVILGAEWGGPDLAEFESRKAAAGHRLRVS
jgi:predicted DNA-binding transcriptional regulator AlpA